MRKERASQRRKKKLFIGYVVFLAILAISFLLMPIASANKEKARGLLLLSGNAFWLGLIGTLLIAVAINKDRKNNKTYKTENSKMKQLGLINFFRNQEALVADVLMFVSILGFIITRLCSGNLYWSFIFLALFVFTFGMHCMLNGENYIYLKYKVRREEKS